MNSFVKNFKLPAWVPIKHTKALAAPVAEIAPPPALEPNSAPPEAAPSATEPMIEKPPPRPPGPVIFPMPAPPDDPGLGGEKEDKDNVRLF